MLKTKVASLLIVVAFLIGAGTTAILSSVVPKDARRNAISASNPWSYAYDVDTWEETNTYTRTRDGEEVHYIEYAAKYNPNKDFAQHAGGSYSGVTYPKVMTRHRRFGVVKRGHEWYIVSKS